MGFFGGLKSAAGFVFNFRVTKWLTLDHLKDTGSRVVNIAKDVYTPEQAETSETFDEAMQRLNISKADLEARLQEFTRLFLAYLLISILVFSYAMYVVIVHKNFMGFCMSFGLTLFALTHAFRYHFWMFQIRNKKLGCSLKDWFCDLK